MPMRSITDDLDALFSADDFGVSEGSAIYKGNPISGILDDEDVEVTEADQTVISHQIVFSTSTSQVPGLVPNDLLTIDGNEYKIEFWKDDGDGQIDLYLSENF